MDAPFPWTPFFKRLEALATAAFLTIPFAGPSIADFCNRIFLPRWSPTRDRILAFVARPLGGAGRALGAALQRLLPRGRGRL
jgi:hypothetical protein